MAYPSEKEKVEGDLRAHHESWKTDWWFYKSIGAKVRCERHVQRRSWWSLWLWNRWVWEDYNAKSMALYASYFHKSERIPGGDAAVRENTSEIKFEHTSWGGSIKIDQDASPSWVPGEAPGLGPDSVEVTAVQSSAKVEAENKQVTLLYSGETGAGGQP